MSSAAVAIDTIRVTNQYELHIKWQYTASSTEIYTNFHYFQHVYSTRLIPQKHHMITIFWSIVYNRSRVYIHQNFLKVVVHVIIIDQRNQIARLYEIQVTLIYSRSILVAVTSEGRIKKIIWNIGKQYRPRSDTAERGIWLGSVLFVWITRKLKVN